MKRKCIRQTKTFELTTAPSPQLALAASTDYGGIYTKDMPDKGYISLTWTLASCPMWSTSEIDRQSICGKDSFHSGWL